MQVLPVEGRNVLLLFAIIQNGTEFFPKTVTIVLTFLAYS